MRQEQVSGGAGLLFVALALVAAAVQGNPPTYTSDGATIAAWFTEHHRRFLVGQTLQGLGFLLGYFPFLVGLTKRLRAEEGAAPLWSRVAWAGGLLGPAAGVTGGVLLTGLALGAGTPSPEVAALAAAGSAYGFIVAGAFGGVVTGAAAIVLRRAAGWWRWLGWFGAAHALAALVGSAAIIERDPAGPLATVQAFAWLGWFIWIAAIALTLPRTATAAR